MADSAPTCPECGGTASERKAVPGLGVGGLKPCDNRAFHASVRDGTGERDDRRWEVEGFRAGEIPHHRMRVHGPKVEPGQSVSVMPTAEHERQMDVAYEDGFEYGLQVGRESRVSEAAVEAGARALFALRWGGAPEGYGRTAREKWMGECRSDAEAVLRAALSETRAFGESQATQDGE